MLGSLFTKVTTSVTSYAASTSLGKTIGVKPAILKEIEQPRTKFNTQQSRIAKLDGIKATPKLNKAIQDLGKAGDAVFTDITSDKSIDILADVVGNHLGDFESVEAFKKAFPEMSSIKEMKAFALELIDFDNYKKLADMLTDIEEFSDINDKERQLEILKSLDDRTLTQAIATENNKLSIDKIHTDVKKMSKAVCKELNLNKSESAALIGLFDDLVKKHLKTFNAIRQQLVEHLPAFFKTEAARLRKAHPELAALKAEKPTITPKFQSKKAATPKKPGKAATHKAIEAEKPHPKRKKTETSQDDEEVQEGKKFTAKKIARNK